jgi:MFS family permease
VTSGDQSGEQPGDRQGEPETAPRPPSLWSNSDYLGWWTGNTASAFGTSVSAIAFPLLVLYTTGSVAKAGSLTAAGLVGALATTLWGGALADRVSRKAILVLGPLVQGLALAVVAVLVDTGHAQLPLLVAAAFVSGLAAGVTAGAANPALRRIVPKEQLATATGQEMGRDLAAELLGTPVGGMLFSVARWFPFAGDAVSFVCASVGAALIRRPLGPDRSAEDERSTVRADIAEGVRLVRGQPFLRFTVVWGALLNTVAQAFALLFIALIRYRGGGPTTVGLVSSMALIGGVAGSIIGPLVASRVRAKLVLYGAAWAFTGTLVLVASVPSPWEIGAVTVVAMLTMVPLNVVLQSYLVRIVPDEFSGRVSAVSRFGLQLLEWTGPLLAGLLVTLFGVPGGVLALLIPLVPLTLALHLTRSLAVLDTPLDDVQELPVPGRRAADEPQLDPA